MLDNNLLKVSSCQAGKRLRVKLAGQEGRAVGEVDTGTLHGPAVPSGLRGWRSGGPAARGEPGWAVTSCLWEPLIPLPRALSARMPDIPGSGAAGGSVPPGCTHHQPGAAPGPLRGGL